MAIYMYGQLYVATFTKFTSKMMSPYRYTVPFAMGKPDKCLPHSWWSILYSIAEREAILRIFSNAASRRSKIAPGIYRFSSHKLFLKVCKSERNNLSPENEKGNSRAHEFCVNGCKWPFPRRDSMLAFWHVNRREWVWEKSKPHK